MQTAKRNTQAPFAAPSASHAGSPSTQIARPSLVAARPVVVTKHSLAGLPVPVNVGVVVDVVGPPTLVVVVVLPGWVVVVEAFEVKTRSSKSTVDVSCAACAWKLAVNRTLFVADRSMPVAWS
jgi:hypothetical protein